MVIECDFQLSNATLLLPNLVGMHTITLVRLFLLKLTVLYINKNVLFSQKIVMVDLPKNLI